jgi:uncharacterized protein YbbK (DUF523 family)
MSGRDPSADLDTRYRLLHGETEAARAELARLRRARDEGREVVVVSACLLGVRCRFDGGDRRDDGAVARVVGTAEVLPLCPEVLARMGVPRPAITLSADGKQATDARGRDVTAALEAGARLADLFAVEAGATRALLKERSPSCGVTQVHRADGVADGEGRFAARLKLRGLPIVGEESP